jgi:hypothetical protein
VTGSPPFCPPQATANSATTTTATKI